MLFAIEAIASAITAWRVKMTRASSGFSILVFVAFFGDEHTVV
jgi:hypothetical protein